MKNITLTDRNGRQFIVEEQDLFDQLANLNIPGSAPAKSIAKKLADATAKMRDAQKRHLFTKDLVDDRLARDSEKAVDLLLRRFTHTIELV